MRPFEFTLPLLFLPLALGCGDSAIERVPVAGEVLIDGRPLGSGTIQFIPKEGRPSSAAIQSDGRFELASESVGRTKEIGAAPGRYRVQVASSKIIDDKTILWNAPAKYADFRTSGLEITIDKPTSDLRIQLVSDQGSAAASSRDRSETANEAKAVNVAASKLHVANNRPSRSTLWYVAGWLVIAICGCNRHPTRVPVSGTVVIDGEPLKQGNITFVPKEGRPSTGKISEGRFTLRCYDANDGALLGTHRVQVAANRIISDSKIEWYAPPKYADFRTADISVDVTQPVDDLKIELKWGDRKGPYIQGR